MPDYKWLGDHADIPSLGLTVKPGEVVTLEEPIDHPLFELVKPPKQPAEKPAPEGDK